MRKMLITVSLVLVVMALILGLVVATGCNSRGSGTSSSSVSSGNNGCQWCGVWVGTSCYPNAFGECYGSPSAYSIELRSNGSCTIHDPADVGDLQGHWEIYGNDIGITTNIGGDDLTIHGDQLWDQAVGYVLERESITPTSVPTTNPTNKRTPGPTPPPAPASLVSSIKVQGLTATLNTFTLQGSGTWTSVTVRMTLINESTTGQSFTLDLKDAATGDHIPGGGGAGWIGPGMQTNESLDGGSYQDGYGIPQKIQVYLNDVFVGEVSPTGS
jgi:hypothetical protein